MFGGQQFGIIQVVANIRQLFRSLLNIMVAVYPLIGPYSCTEVYAQAFTSDDVHCFICHCMSDLEMQEGAEILGKCNECTSFRKPPTLVSNGQRECLVLTHYYYQLNCILVWHKCTYAFYMRQL